MTLNNPNTSVSFFKQRVRKHTPFLLSAKVIRDPSFNLNRSRSPPWPTAVESFAVLSQEVLLLLAFLQHEEVLGDLNTLPSLRQVYGGEENEERQSLYVLGMRFMVSSLSSDLKR
jgi:hypothetical protein